jgi:hypothetical protein
MVRGTRRPFAILARVLIPLVAIFVGAGIWQADRSSAATVAQQEWVIHIINETTALQAVGRTVTLPTDFVTDTSSADFLVGCGENVGRVGCWVDQNNVQTVTAEIVKATAKAGMRYATTTCDLDGLRCAVDVELSAGKGDLRFLVASPRVEAGTALRASASTKADPWQSEIQATVLPADVFSRAYDAPTTPVK